MSVVDSDFEQLKQFNLAEIYDPTPKPKAAEGNDAIPKTRRKSDMQASDAEKSPSIPDTQPSEDKEPRREAIQ